MEQETLRKIAVEQYLRGKSPVSMYHDIDRSKKWFFKWLHRYQSRDANWYQERSKAPHSGPHEIYPDIRKLIIKLRSKRKNTLLHK
jgi:hypothetical protein